MTVPGATQLAHEIAVKAGSQIVKEGSDAGLGWADIAIACETTITIVVATVVEMSGTPRPHALAAEVIDTMTERAQQRVSAYIQGKPGAPRS